MAEKDNQSGARRRDAPEPAEHAAVGPEAKAREPDDADALRSIAADLQNTRERIARTRSTAKQLEANLRETREAVRRTQARVRAAGTGRRDEPR